jgi:hypothetical protein
MGCDIHTHVERQRADGTWEQVPGWSPFDVRDYGLFGFLADVRNSSAVVPIAEPRGIPEDASPEVWAAWGEWAHTPSWLTVQELVEFDYGQLMNDRRVTRQIGPKSFDHSATGSPSEGTPKTPCTRSSAWKRSATPRAIASCSGSITSSLAP